MSDILKRFLGIYEKSLPDEIPLEEKMGMFQKAGYDYFELSIDETPKRMERLDWDEWQIDKFCETMRKMDFYTYSICLSGNRKFPIGDSDPEICRAGRRMIEKAVDFASKTGVRVILIPGYDTYYGKSSSETRERFVQSLTLAARYAAGRGVLLGLENIEKPFMDSADAALEYVRQLDLPYLQCYVDPGNLLAAGYQDPVSQVHRAKGHIAAIHLKDGRPGEFKNVTYGQGNLDFASLFRTLDRDGTFSLLTAEANTLESVQESYENIVYVRKFLEEQYISSKKAE